MLSLPDHISAAARVAVLLVAFPPPRSPPRMRTSLGPRLRRLPAAKDEVTLAPTRPGPDAVGPEALKLTLL